MDIRKLQRAIVDGLEDVKAQNIRVFNTEHLSPLFERVIVASGTSNRQTKALAASVRDTVKQRGMEVLRTEGEGNGEWIIVDCGAAVAHILQPSIREYYHLEEIWGDKPVRLKSEAAATRGLPKAGDASRMTQQAPVRTAAKAPIKPAVKLAAKKAAAKKAIERKPAPAKRTVAVKSSTAAGKAALAKKAAAPPKPRTAVAKAARAPAKTVAAPARKPAAPAKKMAARVVPKRKA